MSRWDALKPDDPSPSRSKEPRGRWKQRQSPSEDDKIRPDNVAERRRYNNNNTSEDTHHNTASPARKTSPYQSPHHQNRRAAVSLKDSTSSSGRNRNYNNNNKSWRTKQVQAKPPKSAPFLRRNGRGDAKASLVVDNEQSLSKLQALLEDLDDETSIVNKPELLQSQTEKIFQLAKHIQNLIRARCASESCSHLFQRAVKLIFLPYLRESAIESDTSAQKNMVDDTTTVVWQTLELLMEPKSKYTTQFLAPLVMEVSEQTGVEVQKPNPIRMQLLEMLQNQVVRRHILTLPTQQQLDRTLIAALQCLRTLLQSARVVEGTTCHAQGNRLDVDPKLLGQLFVSTASASTLQDHDATNIDLCLKLMNAVVQRHPESASAQLLPLLLLSNDNNRQAYGSFHSRLQSNANDSWGVYLKVIHHSAQQSLQRKQHQRKTNEAANLGILLLDHVSPTLMDQWLRTPATTSGRSLTFAEKMRFAMKQWMECCQRCLEGPEPSPKGEVGLLAGTLMRRIPFDSTITPQEDSLLQAGTALAAVLLKRFLQTESIAASQNSRADRGITDGLLKAIGGTETPQGVVLGMVATVKFALDDDRASTDASKEDFLSQIISLSNQQWQNRTKNTSMDGQAVLRALVRTDPGPFLNHENLWTLFVRHVSGLDANEKESLAQDGIQTLSIFLDGRMSILGEQEKFETFPDKVENDILPLLVSVLERESNASSKTWALACFGSLLPRDWQEIEKEQTSQALNYIELIMKVCRDRTVTAKFRKVAFKALGDVCTNYFANFTGTEEAPTINVENQKLCETICEVLEADLRSNAKESSSSMALYAFGNLVRVVNEIPSMLLAPLTLERFAELLLEACDANGENNPAQADPKMKTNAIRGVSHLLCLLYSSTLLPSAQSQLSFFYQEKIDCSSILVRACRSLSLFVRETISIAQSEHQKPTTCMEKAGAANSMKKVLSWKERAAIRKLGWGACHALSLILSTVQHYALDEKSFAASQNCIRILMDCVFNLRIMNEKVVTIAMSALCSIDLSFSRVPKLLVSRAQQDSLVVGPLIVACLEFAFHSADKKVARSNSTDESSLSPKIRMQLDKLLLHMLGCCTVSDAEIVLFKTLKGSDNGTREGHLKLRFLYRWLEEQEQFSLREGGSVARNSVQKAFDSLTLALQNQPDLLSIVDIRLEQQFVSHTNQILPRSVRLDEAMEKISADDDDEDEL